VLRPPRLVGREAEWARLDTAVAAARGVLVSGDPGIGKTRLLADYAASVDGAVVVDARPGDDRIPHAVLARTLRALVARFGPLEPGWQRGELARLVPELGTANAERFDAGALHHAIGAALSLWAGAGLVLIVVDDVQYADEATLAALPVLVGAAGARVAWLVGCRSGELPALLADWRRSGDREALTEIALGPLPAAAIEALLDALELPDLEARRWAEPLWRHTGGNPLFVLETLRALLARGAPLSPTFGAPLPLPPNVGTLIGRRLGQLSATALALARIAAIAGPDFSVELAAHVTGRAVIELVDDWAALEAAHVIRDRGFAHDLVGEAVLRSVPAAIAQVVHRDVARFLEARQQPPGRLAPHWREAHEWNAAAAAFEAAADEALHRSRREDELRLIEEAIACAEQDTDRGRVFRLRARAVDPMLIVRPIDAALALTAQLLADAQTDDERLEAQLRRAYALLMASRFVDAVEVAGSARTLAQRQGQTRSELDAVRFEALGLANSRRTEQAVRNLRDAAPRFEQDADPLQQYKFATDFGHALSQAGQWPDAIEAITRAVGLAEQLGDLAECIVNLTNLAGALGYVGRMADAVVHAERARALRDRMGIAVGAPMAHNDMILGMLYVALGRYREALQAFEWADRHFRAGGAPMWIAVNDNHRALAMVHLGQPARALRLLAADSTLPRSTQARRLTIRARADQALGRAGALNLKAALDLLGTEAATVLRVGSQLDLARELPPAEAVALSLQIVEETERRGLPALAQHARIRAIEGLLRAGDAAPAAALAAELFARLPGCHPSDVYLAETWWTIHRALDGVPERRSEARAALEQGVGWVRDVAARQVPDEFRDSFLDRNPVNRALLAAWGRTPA